MQTAIIYYSQHHGNTKKLLDAIVNVDLAVTLINAAEKVEVDLRNYDRIGFAGAVFNENNDNSAKSPDPLHRLFESDRQRMFESTEDFVWIENENNG